MSQKIESIKDILKSLEKGRELSFTTYSKILVKNNINEDNYILIKNKYSDIHNIVNGSTIFTSFGNRTIDYIMKVNLYKSEVGCKKWIKEMLWSKYVNVSDFYLIFKIENGKDFVNSLLTYIDKLKSQEGTTFSISKQKEIIKEILDTKQKEFGREIFSFEISINKYFNDNIEYYTYLQKEDIEIKNIIIFDGKIKFIVQKNNIQLETENSKSNEFSFIENGGFGILSNGNGTEYKFIKGKNTYYIVKESINRGKGEIIDFIEMIDHLTGKKGQDEMKMVYNAVSYANKRIKETFGIDDFFLVEEKAYSSQYIVHNK